MELEIGLALALVLVVIFGAWFFFKSKKPAPKIESDFDSRLQDSIEIEKHRELELKQDAEPPQPFKETEKTFLGRLKQIFSEEKADYTESIEEILYTSDLGPKAVQRLMDSLDDKLSKKEKSDFELVRSTINHEMKSIFSGLTTNPDNSIFTNSLKKLTMNANGPTVWMIVGVNGAGKTTSIGKLSALVAESGKKVLVAAGDTFRAAAQSQLQVWTERAQVEIFNPPGVTDPSAVAFDAVSKAKAQNYDVVIVDTAGRLHTQSHLMEELKKMKRVVQKVMPDAPHEVLLVLDANSGQNALMQAKEFHQAVGVSGVLLTKMDGSAKGGVALGLACDLSLPVKLIGVGEKMGDLKEFSPSEFVDSII